MREITRIVISTFQMVPNFYGWALPGIDREASTAEFRRLCIQEIQGLYPKAEIVIDEGGETAVIVTMEDGEVTTKWCYTFLIIGAIKKVQTFGNWCVAGEAVSTPV